MYIFTVEFYITDSASKCFFIISKLIFWSNFKEIQDIVSHFLIDNDILINKLSSFIELIGDKECYERSIMACLKLLLNEKLGLSALYPNIIHLMGTAEVERVFSQVKLVKCDHRNCMKQVTLNNILHVKLNCNNVVSMCQIQ